MTHEYHDHSNDELYVRWTDQYLRKHGMHVHSQTGGVSTPFPLKLYETLLAVEKDGFDKVVSWQPHGRCFVVRDADKFKKYVLPRYFKLTKIASFQRQLNLYGFKRLTTGNDRSGYYHEMFLRGRADLIPGIQRVKVKGTNIRAKSNPQDEPDFWNDYPWVKADSKIDTCSSFMERKHSQKNIKVATPMLGNGVPPSPETVSADIPASISSGCVHPRSTEIDDAGIRTVESKCQMRIQESKTDVNYSNRLIPEDVSSFATESIVVDESSFSNPDKFALDDGNFSFTGTDDIHQLATVEKWDSATISILDGVCLLDDEELEYLKRHVLELTDSEFFES